MCNQCYYFMQSWLWYFTSISIMHFLRQSLAFVRKKVSITGCRSILFSGANEIFLTLYCATFRQYKREKFNTEICPLEIARRKSFLAFHAWHSLLRPFSFISNEDTLLISKSFKLSRAITKIRCDFMRIIVYCIAMNSELKTLLFYTSKIIYILCKFINF